MNKRVEIIFDASGSMSSNIAGIPKIEIAKNIFKDTVIDEIKHESNVFLRVLPKDCSTLSSKIKLGRTSSSRVATISNISIQSSTPLYNTIKQAILSAIDDSVTELKLIVLSDGGDTCGGNIDQVLSSKDINDSNLMGSIIIELGQIGSSGLNSLQALSSRIKGVRVPVGVNGRVTKKDLALIKNGLIHSGLVEGKLSKCFGKTLTGNNISWSQLNEMYSINKYHAFELRNAKLLSFDPYKCENLMPYQVKELEFLSVIVYKNNIGINHAITMMHNLEKPYFYSHNCVIWDFNSSKWEKILNEDVSEVKITDFSDQEILKRASDINTRIQKEQFNERVTYIVDVDCQENRPQYILNESNGINSNEKMLDIRRVTELYVGDLVEFCR